MTVDAERLTPDHPISALGGVVRDALPERQIEHGKLRRRKSSEQPVELVTVRYSRPALDENGQPIGETVEIMDRPRAPREPGDELRIAAVQMAERGLPVFELRPREKLPQFKGWQRGQIDGAHVPGRAATCNAGEAWRRWTVEGRPAPFNVGVFTDELLIVDVDAGKAEPIDEAIARMCAELDRLATDAGYIVLHGPKQRAAWRAAPPGTKATSPAPVLLDNTFTVRTGGGGLHFYFRMPDGRRAKGSAGKVLRRMADEASCIDIRGVGGLVVAPGSRTAKGEYTIVRDCPLMVAPEELIRLCGEAGQATDRSVHDVPDWNAETPQGRLDDARAYLLHAGTPISVEGAGGNATGYAVACGLHDRGVSPADAVNLLAEHWNPRCLPPWSDDELHGLVRNASEYADNSFGCRAVDSIYAGVVIPAQEAPAVKASPRVHLFADHDGGAAPAWLIKGLVPRVGISLLVGQSRVGKSFIAHDMCGAVALGVPFFGHKVNEACATLYIASEGASTAPRRLEALRVHKLGGVDKSSLPFAYAPLDRTCRPGDVTPMRELIVEAAAALRARFNLRLGLVVLDTVAAAFADLDENDNGQATQAMTQLGWLGYEFQLSLVAVHHLGKDASTGPRGASGWTASADNILTATGKQDEATGKVSNRALALTKARDAEQKIIADFDLLRVVMGVDEDGDQVTSAVVSEADKAGRGAAAFIRDKPMMKLVRECIEWALVEDGNDLEGQRWTEVEAARVVFKERCPHRGRENINTYWRGSLKACVEGGSVIRREHCGRHYLRTGAATPASLL